MVKTMFKGLIIFGTGVYAGVYIAQNYEDTIKPHVKTKNKEDNMIKMIEKVEDPKVLFEKVQAFVKSKLSEVNDDSKKDK